MKVDRYLVVGCALPDTESWMLVDCLYREVISASDNKKELVALAREKVKTDNAPIGQRHRR